VKLKEFDMNNLLVSKIERMIYVVRDQKVMLDFDLAELYGVETGNLNRAVKRNLIRFPEDFAFTLSEEETTALLKNIGAQGGHGGRRRPPMVFTENGVAMLSSVLSSDSAALVNISIMRIFTKLRSFLLLEKNINEKINVLEQNTTQVFQVVFQRLDSLEEIIKPKLHENRRRISLK
jgi:hypothetical protein